MKSNSFCAGGSFLQRTMLNVGGNPVVEDFTSPTILNVNGIQVVRLFHPCDSEDVAGCDIFDNPSKSTWRARVGITLWSGSRTVALMILEVPLKELINNATVNTQRLNTTSQIHLGPCIDSFPIPRLYAHSKSVPRCLLHRNGYVFVRLTTMRCSTTGSSTTNVDFLHSNGVRVPTLYRNGPSFPLSPETGYTLRSSFVELYN